MMGAMISMRITIMREHLHLGDVVGGARDQRRGADDVELVKGKPFHAGEHLPAQVTSETHAHPGREKRRNHGARHPAQRHGEHQPAHPKDIGDVAFHDPLVDDVRHQRGQVQLGDRACHHQDHRHDGGQGEWLQKPKELEQQISSSLRTLAVRLYCPVGPVVIRVPWKQLLRLHQGGEPFEKRRPLLRPQALHEVVHPAVTLLDALPMKARPGRSA